MQRVLVIGSPGVGKSSFATELAQRTGLPLVHLDQQFWNAGWVETERSVWRGKVAQMVAQDRWIIDGNYSGSLDLRIGRADTVIQLEAAAWVCAFRVLRRVWQNRSGTRADMADGCPERLSLPFIWYILTFPLTRKRRVERRLAEFDGALIKLASRTEVSRFLASIGEGG